MILICPLLLLIIISAVSCVCCWKLQRSTTRFGERDEIQNYKLPSAINLLKIEENNAYGQLELAQREHIYCFVACILATHVKKRGLRGRYHVC